MTSVVAFEDAKSAQKTRRGTTRTPFLGSADTPELPFAFLSQGDPNRVIRTHWHVVDQFQVIVGGSGSLGRHQLAPYSVHFSRAYTPYGPLVGGESGVSFFTLRSRYDPAAQYLPETKEQLRSVENRQPWQVSGKVTFDSGQVGTAHDVMLQKVPSMEDDAGLFACSLFVPANATALAPSPQHGGGQYILVVDGSLWYDARELRAFTLAFLKPDDKAFSLRAGSNGLKAIVMNFPKRVRGSRPTLRLVSESRPN